MKDEEKFEAQAEYLPRLVSSIGIFMAVINIPPFVGFLACLASLIYLLYKRNSLVNYSFYKREVAYSFIAFIITLIMSIYTIITLVNNLPNIVGSSSSNF